MNSLDYIRARAICRLSEQLPNKDIQYKPVAQNSEIVQKAIAIVSFLLVWKIDHGINPVIYKRELEKFGGKLNINLESVVNTDYFCADNLHSMIRANPNYSIDTYRQFANTLSFQTVLQINRWVLVYLEG